MKAFCQLVGKYFGILAIIFVALGMLTPESFRWVVGKVPGTQIGVLNVLMGLIMFGMGTTLSLKDFQLVFQRPLDVFKGALAQFIIMPGLAYFLSLALDLSPELTAGVVLVGACPGGLTSNIITFMCKGDTALSVTMTSVSTALSPILTPFITYLLIGQKISFSPIGMFWSIIQIVIIPICLGVAVNRYLPKLAAEAVIYLPGASCGLICFCLGGIVGSSRNAILANFGIILVVVVLHNFVGYALGFALARLTGMSWEKTIALAIEVGMQNAALAASLAKAHFPAMPMAAVPGAMFAPCTNLSGALLVVIFEKWLNPKYHPNNVNKL